MSDPSKFKQEWEAKKLLNRAKKKAKKTLQKQGWGRKEATKQVKDAVKRITTQPVTRSTGRGE
jgi:hypothetical protein